MIRVFFLMALLALFSYTSTSLARESVKVESATHLDIASLQEISDTYAIPLWALLGVLATEKGINGQAIQNTNGTWDLGAFQINTIHINELTKLGIEAQSLLTNAKVNASVAGWLLAKHVKEEKDIWLALGNYHSKTPSLREKYSKKVYENIMLLQRNTNSVQELLNSVNNTGK